MQQCSVCGSDKHHNEFVALKHRNKKRDSHLRCRSCAVCTKCKQDLPVHKFEGTSKFCRKCIASDIHWKCSTCESDIELKDANFDSINLKNAKSSRNDPLVCLKCREQKGVTPKDTRLYPCPVCGDRGHLKFDAQTLAKHRAGNRQKQLLQCTDCLQTHERSSVWICVWVWRNTVLNPTEWGIEVYRIRYWSLQNKELKLVGATYLLSTLWLLVSLFYCILLSLFTRECTEWSIEVYRMWYWSWSKPSKIDPKIDPKSIRNL